MKKTLGFDKKSFCLYFAGGEIWIEHLDGIYDCTNLAIEKFQKDYQEFKRPSSPSLIAINLDETDVTDSLINIVLNTLICGEKRFRKVVFVGVNWKIKRKIENLITEAPFAYHFINDFEKAKEWLLAGSR